MDSRHRRDHELIASGIVEDWLAHDRLLVHPARDHGFTVEYVSNTGLAVLIIMHDGAHGGVHCFAEAKATLPEDGLKAGLRSLRKSP
jgi:hypothetical protein